MPWRVSETGFLAATGGTGRFEKGRRREAAKETLRELGKGVPDIGGGAERGKGGEHGRSDGRRPMGISRIEKLPGSDRSHPGMPLLSGRRDAIRRLREERGGGCHGLCLVRPRSSCRWRPARWRLLPEVFLRRSGSPEDRDRTQRRLDALTTSMKAWSGFQGDWGLILQASVRLLVPRRRHQNRDKPPQHARSAGRRADFVSFLRGDRVTGNFSTGPDHINLFPALVGGQSGKPPIVSAAFDLNWTGMT